jgi:hypothetical protein
MIQIFVFVYCYSTLFSNDRLSLLLYYDENLIGFNFKGSMYILNERRESNHFGNLMLLNWCLHYIYICISNEKLY